MREVTKGSQYDRMLKKLKRKKGLTMYEAVVECKTTSPHRRISDLRQMGYCIESEWVIKRNKEGKVTGKYKVYRLCA